jgi:branched-chain amino acid transport system ATP-binding protein
MDAKSERQAASERWDVEPVLTVEHLTMRFGGLIAINDLSFNVGRGDITALIGPNGAGKTTVFNCVTGFYKPTEGRIVMRHGHAGAAIEETTAEITRSGAQMAATGDGAVFLLERMPDFVIAKSAKVARTFQNIRLFSGMTVLENLLVAQHNPLMLASAFTIGGIFNIPSYHHARDRAMEKAAYWLDRIRLTDRADNPAADLPYGAQRRLEIARAMCTEPHLLCLDEPAAGLNPRETAELNALLEFIRTEIDTSVLLIEHDMGVVMEISDHIVVLDYGEKISDGSADFVRNDPSVIAAYLGVDDEEVDEVESALDETQAPAASGGAVTTAPSATAAATKPEGLPGPRGGGADDLKKIKGIGPQNETRLNALGVYHFDQIAAWTPAEIEWVGDHLAFPGRIEREDWVGQANTLAGALKKGGAS